MSNQIRWSLPGLASSIFAFFSIIKDKFVYAETIPNGMHLFGFFFCRQPFEATDKRLSQRSGLPRRPAWLHRSSQKTDPEGSAKIYQIQIFCAAAAIDNAQSLIVFELLVSTLFAQGRADMAFRREQ